MASDNLERNLQDGIEAARRGDKLTARRLLQQALQQDRTNETALIWMASVVDTVPEKRSYLEQVLRVNPNNERARQALERMGGAPPPPPRAASASSGTASAPRPAPAAKPASKPRGMNRYFMAAIGVAAVMGIFLLVFLFTQPGAPVEVTPVASPTALAMLAAEGTEDPDATSLPRPTATQAPPATAPGVLVTLDQTQAALPATFTPTPTPEPSATPTPSATPIPLASYALIYAAAKPGETIPSLFVSLADGSAVREVGDDRGYYDLALSPDKSQFVFIRNIAPDEGAEPDWQLFVAPVNSPTDARQISNTPNAGLEHPVWSSDGRSIVYAADYDGDLDLYRLPADPDGDVEPVALTTNDAYDSFPAFAPGSETVLFVSDLRTPGFPRLFAMSSSGVARPFSNVTGSISGPVYSPDGSQIAYVNRQSGDPDLWVMTAAGERPFQLTVNDSADDRSIAWSDDGQWIAFASNRVNNRFMWYLLNVNTQQVVPLGELAEAQSIAFLPR